MELISITQINPVFHQSKLTNPAEHSYEQRMVTEYEFDYILSSDGGKMITNGKTINLSAGMFFIRTPGTIVKGIIPYSSWYVRFQTTDIFPFPTFCCNLSPELCHPIFQQIYDLHVQKPKDYEYQMNYHMNTLLFYLHQNELRRENLSLLSHPLTAIYEEMKHTWNKNFTLDYYAQKSGYSKSHFCHLFKEIYKVSPIQFLHKLRMQNICYQLIETERPIKELMIEHGYNNEQSFFRCFKAHTGDTPLAYRKKHRFN